MGSVYVASHPHLRRLVAVKLLAPRWCDDARAVARFKREMAACGRLQHPNIITTTDAGEAGGVPYLVMEFVKGIDLGRLLRARGPLSVANACELARQAAKGLACIDRHALVHRDVKPSNLLLGQDGVLRILDLGLARLAAPLSESEPLTETGQVMGTGDFIAPEQGLGSRDVDIRADIYGLGCTLYALLAGHPPFAGPGVETFYQKIKAHVEMPAPPLHSRPDVPEGLRDLLARMLTKDPAGRIGSPPELAERLRPFTAGHDLRALLDGIELGPDLTSPAAPGPMPEREVAVSTCPPDDAQATTAARTRPVRRWPAAGAAVALLAVCFGVWLTVHKPAGPAPAGRGEVSAVQRPGVVRQGEHFLLERPPQVVSWPAVSPNSLWTHDPKKRELWVNCEDRAVLQLAEVQGEAFALDVTFVQNPWVGGIGLFFRGRDDPGDGKGDRWGDLIYLQPFRRAGRETPVRLTRGFLRRHPGNKSLFLDLIRTQTVPQPVAGEHRLKISVGPDGLESVLWDGVAADARLRDPHVQMPRRVGARGAVGILVQDCSVLVRSVHLSVRSSS
jgi:hypothetical protein